MKAALLFAKPIGCSQVWCRWRGSPLTVGASYGQHHRFENFARATSMNMSVKTPGGAGIPAHLPTPGSSPAKPATPSPQPGRTGPAAAAPGGMPPRRTAASAGGSRPPRAASNFQAPSPHGGPGGPGHQGGPHGGPGGPGGPGGAHHDPHGLIAAQHHAQQMMVANQKMDEIRQMAAQAAAQIKMQGELHSAAQETLKSIGSSVKEAAR